MKSCTSPTHDRQTGSVRHMLQSDQEFREHAAYLLRVWARELSGVRSGEPVISLLPVQLLGLAEGMCAACSWSLAYDYKCAGRVCSEHCLAHGGEA